MTQLAIELPMISLPSFNKDSPFLATIKERRWLSRAGSDKHTYHIVLDVKGSGYTYSPGDSIGVYPINSSQLVNHTLEAFGATGQEIVSDKNGKENFYLREFLARKANLCSISRKFFNEIALRQKNAEKKEHLNWLLGEGHKDALKAYLESHQVWDLLLENAPIDFTHQELVNLLMPLLPRLYSIASAQSVVGDEVHLTVSRLRYESNAKERFGVCTHYLCDLIPMNEPIVPVYIQPHHGFTIPSDPHTDIIMVGPGTGVAPYRAFMQQRMHQGATGRNWLFFGEWHRAFDFFYEEYWQKLEGCNHIRIDTAFSRDQDNKIYVQHRMQEHAEELFEWLNSGAILYVCGDAHRMAKDVDATLHHIIEKCGSKTELEARAYVKELRHSQRYLRDIY